MNKPPLDRIYKLRCRPPRFRRRRLHSSFGMIYKSWPDARHAAENLKKRNTGVDTVVRVEKAPYGDGYIVRSTPVCVETVLMKSFLRFGIKMPSTLFTIVNSDGPGFGGKD